MAFNPDASYTYYGKEAAELALLPAVQRPALSDIFAIREGIKGKQYLRFLQRVGLITKLDPGCNTTGSALPVGRSTKAWNPVDLLAEVKECWKDAAGTAEEWALNAGNDKYILDDTTYGLTYADLVSSAVFEDLHRMAHFANNNLVAADMTASITLSNGVTYTAAQLLPFFKTFDGLWRNIEKGIAAGLTKYVAITQNSTSGSQVFAPADAYPLLNAMFAAADPRLNSQPLASKQLLVTRSIYSAWEQYRESQNLEIAYKAMGDGVLLPTFRGVTIQVVDEWDEFINAFFKPTVSSVTKPTRPHRAILTVRGNLQLGFDATPVDGNGQPDLEIWSNRDNRTWNSRAQYKADQQNADDALVVAAY